MDFYQIKERSVKSGVTEIYPDFQVNHSKDLMVRGGSFYAIWDEEKGLWSTDEYDVARLVDAELMTHKKEVEKFMGGAIRVMTLESFSSNSWKNFKTYLKHVSDNFHQLDEKITFSNTEVKKRDYISRRLPYSLEEGSIDAYDELIRTLYDPDERAKLEWAIGAVISGDASSIQKFIVLYGEAGTGKSTVLNIIQRLFEGYYTTFEAKALTGSSNAFATEVFKGNPLVAIQHDGDLSRIEDNTKLNSIISHEEMVMNEKYKSSYTSKLNCFLFMGTNRPVKITDAKSGIIRRLIDVRPSGRKIPARRYNSLMDRIGFELGAIANHCLKVYQNMGKNYYNGYRPTDMILQTDVFFNFVEENFFTFKQQDSTTLSQAYEMYKTYCDTSSVDFKLPKYKFREELKNYFSEFQLVARKSDGSQVRSYYHGFLSEKFDSMASEKEQEKPVSLVIDKEESIFDEEYADQPAQYATSKETPGKKWSEVETKLKDVDTRRVHYVKLPENHIVIDFDLKDDSGKKSLEKNLEAASKWPKTYAEFSKSGTGIHLHYIYEGDPARLSRVYADSIEIKVFTGNSSLRRKFTKSNGMKISTINSGLPLKGEKMINYEAVKSEKRLRDLILKNLKKEIHPGTKPSVDFIYKLLEDAYNSGMHYDVTDMRPKILAFAVNSTNQSDYCVKLVSKMQFKSEEQSPNVGAKDDAPIVFFDVEVFPNLFLVNWKYAGDDKKCVRMINPTPQEVAKLFDFRLIGFNCRRYDNHILYARYIGYTNEQLFELSQRIVNGSKNGLFGEAYNISYTDVYDFASAVNKKSLKKFEIELGIHHKELGYPWDQPIPEEKWNEVAEYCDNDVISTEKVFEHLKGDWVARQILAELSGLSVNDTTNSHSYKIIFGEDKTPKGSFNYRDLSKPVSSISPEMEEYLKNNTPLSLDFDRGDGVKSVLPYFPGYTFERGKSSYRGEDPSEGGYVYAEPGIHYNVALLDVASMHPSSAECECLFGPIYTQKLSDLKKARILIKHKDIDGLSTILDGKLKPFVEEAMQEGGSFSLKDLSNALKTVINSIYGLTSAKFDNLFKDNRNIDNIVAKRGALFMIDLKHEVQSRGFKVAHIKTDSIKIPDATPEIIQFVMDFGKKYGYTFEHEATYEKMCLVNDAVYIAKYAEWCAPRNSDGSLKAGRWTPTGAEFMHPYIFKTLFSHEKIEFKDYIEPKSVTSAIYLDFNESLGEEHNHVFIGRVGAFIPVKNGCNGGLLMREKDGKYYAVGGSKGYRWKEAETIRDLGLEDEIDLDYYRKLVDSALDTISEFGDAERFVSDDPVAPDVGDPCPPWADPSNCDKCEYFRVCPNATPF